MEKNRIAQTLEKSYSSWLRNTKHENIHNTINHRGIMELNNLLVRNNLLNQLGIINTPNTVEYTFKKINTRIGKGKIKSLIRTINKRS